VNRSGLQPLARHSEATMPTTSSLSHIALFALGLIALSAPPSAAAQGFSGSSGQVEYDDEKAYEVLLPPRPVPGYGSRYGAVETTVTTTRRIVTTRPTDIDEDEPGTVVTTRRVIVPAPIRRPQPADVVITTGSVRPVPLLPPQPVYKSEPVYAPAPAWRRDSIAAQRPAASPQPVIIEERRVETTRRILAPAPLD